MEVIPAIDLIGGRCVRLTQGRYDQETTYSNNPVEVAKRWEAQGAQRLHLIDLEGARAGEPRNMDVIREICRVVSIPTQMGGGIRTIEIARHAIDVGVGRVIIGTSAAVDTCAAEVLFGELGEKAILGVDSKDGTVAVSGWEAQTQERAVEFARRMQELGVCRIIFTNISRDGALVGVDADVVEEMVKAVDIPVIAAGGVTTVEDIRRLKPLELFGLEGAIIGKALYAGSITLPDALLAAQDN